MMLGSTVVLAIAGAGLSSLPFSVLFADGTLIAILASVTSPIVADMQGAPAAAVGATLTATLALGTAATGLALWLIGRLRAGGIIRYVPFQVTAGVLAAGGWALTMGGIAVAAGHPASLALITDPPGLKKLAPALILATVMLAATRLRRPATLPLIITAAALLHHLTFAALGWPLAAQRDAGWLIAVAPRQSLGLPWSPSFFHDVDWTILGHHAPDLLALLPVAAITPPPGLTGIEAATERDIDVDQDLRANGVAAMVCGALGGVLGITSVSRTLLMFTMGARGRRASLFAGLAGGMAPLVWPQMLGLIPIWMLGGLLLFSGLALLRNWAVASRKRLSWFEWATVLAVLAIAARFGLIIGAFSGLLLGCITFAVIYSRTSPIRARYGGGAARSNVERSAAEQAHLAAKQSGILVLHLQGFLFFGTASRLTDELKAELAAAPGALHHLVLDFAHVGGVDGSALGSFVRLQRLAAAKRIALVLCAMPPAVAARLRELPTRPDLEYHVAATLDDALEWCEDRMLPPGGHGAPPPLADRLADVFDDPADAAAFIALLQPEDRPAGTILMRQGERSDDLLFLEAGRASVTVQFNGGAAMRVRRLGAGTMVGEVAFCLGVPRTATVQADTACHVLRLSRGALRDLQATRPAAALAFQRLVMGQLGATLLHKDRLMSALLMDRPQ